jgi:hypothetical protein
MSREDAVQRCPVEKNAPLVAHSTATLSHVFHGLLDLLFQCQPEYPAHNNPEI